MTFENLSLYVHSYFSEKHFLRNPLKTTSLYLLIQGLLIEKLQLQEMNFKLIQDHHQTLINSNFRQWLIEQKSEPKLQTKQIFLQCSITLNL